MHIKELYDIPSIKLSRHLYDAIDDLVKPNIFVSSPHHALNNNNHLCQLISLVAYDDILTSDSPNYVAKCMSHVHEHALGLYPWAVIKEQKDGRIVFTELRFKPSNMKIDHINSTIRQEHIIFEL